MAETYAKAFDDVFQEIEQARARLLNGGKPTEMEQDIWKETPVSPREFFISPDFVNDTRDPYAPGTEVWPVVREDIEHIFSGPDKFGNSSYFPICNTYLNVSGYGVGKSAGVAWIDTYYTYLLLNLKDPRKYYGLKATFLFLNVAPTEAKAND
ncbi:hypothetical protein LCGC14_3169290, partial [marine sediment metagenome]